MALGLIDKETNMSRNWKCQIACVLVATVLATAVYFLFLMPGTNNAAFLPSQSRLGLVVPYTLGAVLSGNVHAPNGAGIFLGLLAQFYVLTITLVYLWMWLRGVSAKTSGGE
jgi:hypothetical protein